MTFFYSGQREGFKGLVHASFGLLSFLCLGYNVIAVKERWRKDLPTSHLIANALVYSGVLAYEASKVVHHLREVERREV